MYGLKTKRYRDDNNNIIIYNKSILENLSLLRHRSVQSPCDVFFFFLNYFINYVTV